MLASLFSTQANSQNAKVTEQTLDSITRLGKKQGITGELIKNVSDFF